MRLEGKVVAVTGAGNGIGRHTALRLLERGAHVALIDVQEGWLRETRSLAGPRGNRVSLHAADVTDVSVVDALPAAVIAAHGQIDALINVAGIIHPFAPVTDLDRSRIERVMQVNFWGTVNMCLAFLPELRQRPQAGLVNISSLSALVPFAGQTFYSATKGAVKQFSEGLYQELLDTNVAVTTVFPGNISTALTGNSGVEMIDTGGRKVPVTTPERTAESIVAGLEKGSFRVLVGRDASLLDRLVRLAPRRAADVVAKQMKSVL
ncbi:SDR family NAD(P)-dependent oxidoreductase [Nocardia sputorum]|uniref:Oxidoreductase n=1 Tax=Nocardia sputorum TaxID=2984338 RepID=A0ABM8CYD8_9NOCA|nr:SDR family oxidoreductase [Nocardia sputorum]BDT91398.1 oxidoreductase [Nocardia sputorum]BDU00034.1 oxidoreductase [Nocardia sputorum]